MTLRFASPTLSPMLSLFAVPAIVGIVAITQLMSLDGLGQKSVGQPVGQPIAIQPHNAPEKLVKPKFDSELDATTTISPTEQERYNTTLSQIQDGDWLIQQGQFNAAKAVYHQALSQTQNADLAATATDRLNQLSRQLALKSVIKPAIKSVVKPAIKPAIKPVVKISFKPVIKPTIKPVVKSESKTTVSHGVKSVAKLVKESPRNSVPESFVNPSIKSTAGSIANPTLNPIATPTAFHLLPPSTSPAALPPEQSPSPETPPPAQTIGVESPQWDSEPPAQLN